MLKSNSNALAIVDATVAGHELLANTARSQGLEVIVLSGDGNGFAELTAALEGRDGIQELHLISHGSEGEIRLGEAVLSAESLGEQGAALTQIRESLAPDGDLLVYGCDVGDGEIGAHFVEQLAIFTAADVAASDDITGAATLGGDWDLETQTGSIDAAAMSFSGFMQTLAIPGDQTFDFAGFVDDGATLSSSYFAVSGGISSNPSGPTGTQPVDIYAPGVAYVDSAALSSDDGATFYMEVRADGTNVGSFELTGLTAGEYGVFDFQDVYIVGSTVGGGTITSSVLPGTGLDNMEAWSFSSTELSAFAEQQLTSFRLYATDIDGNPPSFEFRSFSIADAQAPTPPDTTPTLAATGADPAFTEGDSAVDLFTGVTAAVNDTGQSFSGMTLTVTNVSNGSSEILTVGGTDLELANGNSGTVTGIGNFAVSVAGGIATVTLSGMTHDDTQMGALIDGMTYRNDSQDPGSADRVVTIVGITDSGTGNNSSMPNIASTIAVTAVNDAPTATNLTQSKSATEGGSAVALDDIVVTDVDTSDTITATLTLSNPAAGTLTVGTFGSATSTHDAGAGVWTVTGSVTDVNAALAAVALTPSVNNDDDFSITTQIRDAAGTGPTDGTITVDITPVNDAPVLTMSGGVKSADEGLATVIDSGLTVSDIDSATLASATVAITGNFQSGEDGLAFANDGSTMGNIAASYNAATGTMTLTSAGATATQAQWQDALRAVTYANTSDTPSTAGRTITFEVSDGSDDSNATKTVAVVAINDAPVVTAPASIDAVEGEAKELTGISFSDVDAGSASVTVTLSAPAGVIAATSGSGVTVGGTASALTLSGTIADINAFIVAEAVSYTPPSGSAADVSLTVGIDDGGNTGSDGAKTDTEVVTIDVGPAVPKVTDSNISISGASGTGGAFKIGDTVTATWDDTASGDNNADTISAVAVDFSAFGGGSAVAATNLSGTWTATYTIVSGAVDTTNRNVSVTATNSVGPTITADTTNATVDSIAPTVTDANVAISGGTGTGGAYVIGDTITATWNNTAGGDNNSDTISGATVDFSQFGGGAAVAATNSSGTWTATYTVTAGTLDATNRNVAITAIDNAGNTTTTADTTNATLDNAAPTVTDVNLSISGGSGAGGAFIVGDTVTATWDNTAATGDNNFDALAAVTVDFSAFGGGSTVTAANASGIWTAVHTITAGSIEAANVNVAVTVTDDAGNSATVADSSNASVDTDVSTVDTVTVPANGTYTKGETLSFAVTFDDTVTVDTSGGSPRLAVALNTGGTAFADYVSGSGSTALVFELQVASGQVDKDGIEITALEANGASLTDASGNATDLTLNGVADTSAVLIDAPAPSGGGGDEDEDDGDTATTPTAAEVINATPPADGSPITITGKDGIDEVHIAGSVILGDGLENAVISGTGDYTVETNDLDNIVYGNVGDTTIYASGGRDFIDGGYGDNTVVFDGESSGYAVRFVDGVAQVTTLETGDVTTIANVSVLQFADGEQPLFATGQGMVAGFYEAFLGRKLDEAGFEYWMGQSASGMDAFEMVQHFIAPPEFGERTESLTTAQFVEWLYVGFLDREPDATGLAYWIDAIEGGTSYADAAANFVFAEEVGIRIDELLDRNDWLHIV